MKFIKNMFKTKTNEELEQELKELRIRNAEREERNKKINELRELKSKNTFSGKVFNAVSKIQERPKPIQQQRKIVYVQQKPKPIQQQRKIVYVQQKPKPIIKKKSVLEKLEEQQKKILNRW